MKMDLLLMDYIHLKKGVIAGVKLYQLPFSKKSGLRKSVYTKQGYQRVYSESGGKNRRIDGKSLGGVA